MLTLFRLVWIVPVAILLVAVFLVKGAVEEREKDLARLKRDIAEEREAIQVLRAEWAHVNRPEHLRRLAAGRLDMAPVQSKSMASLDRVIDRMAGESAMTAEAGTGAKTEAHTRAERDRRRAP